MMNIKAAVAKLMTPKSLLALESFPDAQMILPDNFIDFESLLERREEIRLLKVLPVKHDEVRTKYRQDKEGLYPRLLEAMGSHDVFFKENEYPYFLPPDVHQGILWVKDGVEEDYVYARIADIARSLPYPHPIILFERSRIAQTALVKGTFPQMRHIHCWFKKEF